MSGNKTPSMNGAFEKLRKHYTPVNVIKYMDFVREQSLDVILENAQYIYVEPTHGAQTLHDIVSKSVLTESQSLDLYRQLTKFIHNNISANAKGEDINRDHYNAVHECLNLVNDICQEFKKDALAVKESTIYNLHMQYLSPLMESRGAEKDIDRIIYGIDKDPKLVDEYVALIKKIEAAKTVTNIVSPVTLIVKNTSLLIGTAVLITGVALTVIVSVPMILVGAFMDGRMEKKYAKSYTHILDGEIKKVEASIPKADKDKQKVLKDYLDNLKEARSKMDEISKDDNKIVRAYKTAKADVDAVKTVKESVIAVGLGAGVAMSALALVDILRKDKDGNRLVPYLNNSYKEMKSVVKKAKTEKEINEAMSLVEKNLSEINKRKGELLDDDKNIARHGGIIRKSVIDDYIKQCNKLKDELEKKKVAVKEGIAEMQPDVIYAEEGDGDEDEDDELNLPDLDFIRNEFALVMVETFMDETEDGSDEISIENFNRLLRIANSYGIALEAAAMTSVTEAGAITNGLRKGALGAEKISRNTAHGVRKWMTNRQHYTAPMKRIPQHIDNLIDNTIGRLKQMDKNERRNRIVEGGFRVKLFKLIRNGILIGGIALVNPAVAAIGLLATIAIDKKLDSNVRRQILDEMEDELKIVNEKIEDSKSYQDKEKKYQLMRIKNKLEDDIQRIQYRLDRY